ncbi:MAG: cysteine--tRNA ligase [Candidatus Moraniibacteriota bacterium]
MLTLYNTLTKKKEDFSPLTPGEVKMYTCGPTVYNFYHIGNLRNAVFNDTLRRVLEAEGLSVKHVMNVTDVGHLVSDGDEGEDKLEAGAKREGKTVWEVAKMYTDAFKRDMAALNVLQPNVDPKRKGSQEQGDFYARATDFIPEQIEMVKILLEKGFAYQTAQAIYFEVSRFEDYSLLSGQKLTEKEAAVRSEIVTDPDKRSPHDFAIWFFAVGHFASHTMKWESPWGEGFPGWHLECSAIIHATLGEPIDIHTGGIDHIGTHHPNEIAQTKAAYDKELAQFWVHNEFILVNGEKMSKSKGNSFLLEDILERGFSAMDLRMLFLSAHYRTQMNFTWEAIAQAKANRETLMQALERLKTMKQEDSSTSPEDAYAEEVTKALEDDLNTPLALTWALNMAKSINIGTNKNKSVRPNMVKQFEKILFDIFGLTEEVIVIPEEVTQLVHERDEARRAKDFPRSDELRAEIEKLGFIVEDSVMGQKIKKL